MAQFYWTATDYAVGTLLEDAGWTLQVGELVTAEIEEVEGRNVLTLDHESASSSTRLITLDEVPESADVEIFCLDLTRDSGSFSRRHQGMVARVPAGELTGYAQERRGNQNGAGIHTIRRYNNNSTTELATEDFDDWDTSDFNYIAGLLRVQGDQLQSKVWFPADIDNPRDDEPTDWSLVTTDTNITAAGLVGYYMRITASSARAWRRILEFSVGTDGDPAPTEQPETGDVHSADLSAELPGIFATFSIEQEPAPESFAEITALLPGLQGAFVTQQDLDISASVELFGTLPGLEVGFAVQQEQVFRHFAGVSAELPGLQGMFAVNQVPFDEHSLGFAGLLPGIFAQASVSQAEPFLYDGSIFKQAWPCPPTLTQFQQPEAIEVSYSRFRPDRVWEENDPDC